MAKTYVPAYLYNKQIDEYVPNRELFEKGSSSTTEGVYSATQLQTVDAPTEFDVVAESEGLGLVTINTSTGEISQNKDKLQYSGALGIKKDGWVTKTDATLAGADLTNIAKVEVVKFNSNNSLIMTSNISASGSPQVYYTHPDAEFDIGGQDSHTVNVGYTNLQASCVAGDSIVLVRGNRLSVSDEDLSTLPSDPTQALTGIAGFSFTNYAPIFSNTVTSVGGCKNSVAIGFNNGTVSFVSNLRMDTPVTALPAIQIANPVTDISIVDRGAGLFSVFAVVGGTLYSIKVAEDLSEVGEWEVVYDGVNTFTVKTSDSTIFAFDGTTWMQEIAPNKLISSTEDYSVVKKYSGGTALANTSEVYTVVLGEVKSILSTTKVTRGDEKVDIFYGYTLNDYLYYDLGAEKLEWAVNPILAITPDGINPDNVIAQYSRETEPEANIITFQEKFDGLGVGGWQVEGVNPKTPEVLFKSLNFGTDTLTIDVNKYSIGNESGNINKDQTFLFSLVDYNLTVNIINGATADKINIVANGSGSTLTINYLPSGESQFGGQTSVNAQMDKLYTFVRMPNYKCIDVTA